MAARPGLMGRAIPGHAVAVADDAGEPLPDGTPVRLTTAGRRSVDDAFESLTRQAPTPVTPTPTPTPTRTPTRTPTP